MPGDAHVFTTNSLALYSTLHPWPRIMDSAGKRRSQQMEPAYGPPLQARVAAANGTVLAAGKLLALTDKQTAGPANGDDPGAHGNERGQAKHNGRGKAN